MRRLHDVKLRRAATPVFQMSWLVIHDIDEDSPFFGETDESLNEKRVRMIVSLTGLDGTFSQMVHARHVYDCVDFEFGRRFDDVLDTTAQGTIRFDYRRFHTTLPMPDMSEMTAPAAGSSASADAGDGARSTA